MTTEPLYTYSRTGFTLRVHANRIDVEERKLFKTDRESIVLRNVTDVAVIPPTGKLRITTTDGKRREWVLGRDAEAARDAILAAL